MVPFPERPNFILALGNCGQRCIYWIFKASVPFVGVVADDHEVPKDSSGNLTKIFLYCCTTIKFFLF